MMPGDDLHDLIEVGHILDVAWFGIRERDCAKLRV